MMTDAFGRVHDYLQSHKRLSGSEIEGKQLPVQLSLPL